MTRRIFQHSTQIFKDTTVFVDVAVAHIAMQKNDVFVLQGQTEIFDPNGHTASSMNQRWKLNIFGKDYKRNCVR